MSTRVPPLSRLWRDRRAPRRTRLDHAQSWVTAVLLAGAVAMVVLGLTLGSTATATGPSEPAGPASATPLSGLARELPAVPTRVGKLPPPGTISAPSAPVRLQVPSLGIDAPVVSIGVDADAVLTPPSDYRQVGYWNQSAEPGSTSGQTVITGHTVHTGGGALDRLPELRRGQTVDITTDRGTVTYAVRRAAALDRVDVARYAQNLFGQDRGDGRLMLISCTDWNGVVFERNIVVMALPVG